MAFVSYAQNFEDVMLWRALRHVENGCYVDVGAQHPIVDSVSKAFYERGWRGIHIEPLPEYAELLRQDRPDETVLQIALGDYDGIMEFNAIPGTGLSTGVEAHAQRHRLERGLNSQRLSVPVLTLKSATRSLNGRDVHWLKIDVEGLEEKVLKGWDSNTLRPWIMVVEATVPNSPEVDYADWDPILTAANYQFVYFDGLNRFYLAEEHVELVPAFSCPPNFFDGLQLTEHSVFCQDLVETQLARQKALVAETESRARWLQDEWDAAKQRLEDLNQRVGTLDAELQAGYGREASLQRGVECLQSELDEAKSWGEDLRERAAHLESELQAAHERETALERKGEWLQNELEKACGKADSLACQLKSVYESYSWRIMAGARAVWHFGVSLLRLPLALLRSVLRLLQKSARSFLLKAMATVLTDPVVTARAMKILRKVPILRGYLRGLALRGGLITSGGVAIVTSGGEARANTHVANAKGAGGLNLPPRAAYIYRELRRAIESGSN